MKADTEQVVVTTKTGEGPWKVTYHDGVVSAIETWEMVETPQGPTAYAHHVLRRNRVVQIIQPQEDR